MSVSDTDHVERQRQARARVQRQTRHLRWSRWADREMPLAQFYRTWGWPDGRYCRVVEDRRTA